MAIAVGLDRYGLELVLVSLNVPKDYKLVVLIVFFLLNWEFLWSVFLQAVL